MGKKRRRDDEHKEVSVKKRKVPDFYSSGEGTIDKLKYSHISHSRRSSSSRHRHKHKRKSDHKKKKKVYSKSSSSDESSETDSSSSSSTSSSSTSSSSSDARIKMKRHKKKKRKHKKSSHKHLQKTKPVSVDDNVCIGPLPPDNECKNTKSMAPMTKEEWEKRQNVVKKVYDEETGRYRLIKGDGEVLEEIVSRDRHKEINRQATRGDGSFFESTIQNKLKTKLQ